MPDPERPARHADRLRVVDLAAMWLERDPAKRQSTRVRDESVVRVHITPAIGTLDIGAVRVPDVQHLVNHWSTSLRARTVGRQYAVLRAMFDYAVLCDWLERTPCRGIRLPRVEPLERPVLTPHDVAAIADAMDPRDRPMVWVGALLGLRWAEVAGLSAGCLDTDARILTVRRQLGRDRTLAPPKSRAGVRDLAVPDGLCEMLTRHLADTSTPAEGPDRLMFRARHGGPLHYAAWRYRVWQPAVARAGVEGASFHDLRRANATVLVAEHVDVKTAQTRLGHADPWTTLAIYARATTEGDRDAAERLWRRFAPPGRPEGPPKPTGERRPTPPSSLASPGTV